MKNGNIFKLFLVLLFALSLQACDKAKIGLNPVTENPTVAIAGGVGTSDDGSSDDKSSDDGSSDDGISRKDPHECLTEIYIDGDEISGKTSNCVYICHVPPGQSNKTIELRIGTQAVEAHLRQHREDEIGDYIGHCED